MLVPLGNNGGALVPAAEAGIALLDRLQLLDDVLRPAGEEAAGLHRILDPRQFHGPRQPRGSRIAAICSPVNARTRRNSPNIFMFSS